MPDAASVTIERRHRGFGVPDRSEVYPLVLRGDVYTGDSVIVAGPGSWARQRTESRSVSVPRDAMQEMLLRLADVRLDERPYVPSQPATDDYPEIVLQVALSGRNIRFFTQSQGPSNFPWGVEHAGRTFVVRDDSVSAALKLIEEYLLGDLVRQMLREMEDVQRQRTQKP